MHSATTGSALCLPASFTQERLWILNELDPGNPTYNLAAAVRLRGSLDVSALRESLNHVVRRHETLRTRFNVIDGRIFQVISPELELDLPLLPSTEFDPLDFPEAIRRYSNAIAQHRFDLTSGPLVRVALLKHTSDDHALFLTLHHTIADGWSTTVLIREVMEFYRAVPTGETPRLADLSIQYADFAQWQRKWLTEAIRAKEVGHWKHRLANISPMDLPADYARPPIAQHKGERQTLVLPPALHSALLRMAKQQSATLFMVMLAAFKALLHRYTGNPDIVIGSPIAGRNRKQLEELIGCFLNTVVLRSDLAGDPPFSELLKQVRETCLDAYSHQDLPFEQLLQEINPSRDASRTPIFQVFFNMLNFPALRLDLPGLTVEEIEMPELHAKFDLTLYVQEKNETLRCDLVYDAQLFAADRMAEMLRQYEFLLRQFVEDPRQPISNPSLLTTNAQSRLPNPRLPLDSQWEGSVQEIFREKVAEAPEAIAVSDPHVVWSYGHLDQLTNRIASHLVETGIRPQDIVAIYGHRSCALVAALLGVLKAGAGFLIQDPAYPVARLLEFLKIANPCGWLQLAAAGNIPEELQAGLQHFDLKCNLILPEHDGIDKALASYSAQAVDVAVGPDHLAYISFTSGSSGKPKGVLGRHGSLTHFLPWLKQEFSLGASDRFTMLSALSHDPLHRDTLLPLMLGSRICIPSADTWQDPGNAAAWMCRNEVSVTNLTPAIGRLILEGRQAVSPCLNSLRYAFFVGEVLTRRDIARFYEFSPRSICVNLYGATETQRAVSFLRVPPAHSLDHGPDHPRPKEVLPLGHGIKDVQLLVIAGRLQQAGVGEVGEIYFRSPHIALGYKDDPALSHEKFGANWFTGDAGDTMYRTGDLGRYSPDGSVEALGRSDQQVKIRGFRVELEEIEALLKKHSLVKAAAVIAREDTPGNKQIVAYVALQDQPPGWQGQLGSFVRKALPEYMVPSAFVPVTVLPLTANGKLDRRALPAPDRCTFLEDAHFVEPRSPLEQEVALMVKEVLNVPVVGLYDNFFKLGGHSLLAIRLLARLESAFNVKIGFQQLFRRNTVAELSSLITQGQARDFDPEHLASLLTEIEQVPD